MAKVNKARISLAAIGFTSVVGQVLLMREFIASFYGNELLLGLILTAWLSWVAIGSALGSRCRLGERFAIGGLGAAAVILPLQLTLIRATRLLLHTVPGALVDIVPTVLCILLIPAPLCTLLGLLFSVLVRAIPGPSPGTRAYLWESTGAIVGGILLSIIPFFDPLQVALFVSVIDLAASSIQLLPYNRSPLVLILLLIMMLVAFLMGQCLHDTTIHWQQDDLVFVEDSPYGRLSVVSRAGQTAFFENNLLVFDSQSTSAELTVHIALLSHPAPQSVLLVGGGVDGSLREILTHPVEEVVYVELDSKVISAGREYLSSEDVASIDDPRVQIELGDGRHYVQTTERSYDVVIINLPDPSTGALNRFYTQEFFQEVREVLTPGGLLSLGLSSAENYWSPELAWRNSSVYWSLLEAFPYVQVVPGERNLFLASENAVPDDAEILLDRMTRRGIVPVELTPAYVEYLYTTDRFRWVTASLEEMEDVHRNRDRRPVCYFYDLTLWLSRFDTGFTTHLKRISLAHAGWVALPLMAVALLGRWKREWAVSMSMAAIGLAGMALQVLIIFSFQVDHGTLYGRMSFLVTAFMVGLAPGALGGRRLAGRARRALLAVLVAFACVAGLVVVLPSRMPEAVYYLLALGAGGLAGMAFPLAIALTDTEIQRAAGVVYAADLFGGSIGALVTAAFLVPLLGLAQTALVVVLVVFTAIAVML